MPNTELFPTPGTEPLAPGNFYTVLCVRAFWPMRQLSGAKPRWVPVIGPVHSDQDVVNFPPMHWHADHRFLDIDQLWEDRHVYQHFKYFEQSRFGLQNIAYRSPIVELAPLTNRPDETRRFVDAGDLDHAVDPPDTYQRLMVLRYRGDFGSIAFTDADYLPELTEQYRAKTLIEGRYCPHRRADLGSLHPDADGIITCPLHGLRWRQATGEIADALTVVEHDPFDPYFTEPDLIQQRLEYEATQQDAAAVTQ